jgi:hypothetical protein
LKLKDITITNWDHFYYYGASKLHFSRQDGEDAVHSAWESLVIQDKEYVNEAQAIFFFKLRIRDYCFNARRLVQMAKKSVVPYLQSMELEFPREPKYELKQDADKIINFLSKKGKRFGDIFKAMLDIGEFGSQAEIAEEIGMTPNNFKVQLIKVRNLSQDFVEGGYIRPSKETRTTTSTRAKELHFRKQW